MKTNTKPKSELRSNRIREILNEKPHWIVRWGITVLFIISVIVFILFKILLDK